MEFPMEIKWLLSLGGKFATPVDSTNFPLFAIIADVESCLFPIEDEQEKETIRARITNVIMNTRFPQFRGIDRLIHQIKIDSIKFLNVHLTPINVRTDIQAIITNLFNIGFSQVVGFTNAAGNVLDLLFVNDTDNLCVTKAKQAISKVDIFHQPFEFFLDVIDSGPSH